MNQSAGFQALALEPAADWPGFLGSDSGAPFSQLAGVVIVYSAEVVHFELNGSTESWFGPVRPTQAKVSGLWALSQLAL